MPLATDATRAADPDLRSRRVESYRYFDCDNHCYEPRDAFTRHLPKEYLDRAITTVHTGDGTEMILAGGRIAKFTSEAGLCFETADRPGSLHEILRKKDTASDVKWGSSYSKENMLPAFQHRDARLALMDDQGVECAILLPTFAVGVEHCMMDDVEQTYANLRSFNRWLEEEWGFGGDGRIEWQCHGRIVGRVERRIDGGRSGR